MCEKKKTPPIALTAYERLAERFAMMADTKVENALSERPATLSLIPDVNGLRVLDAGCGPGFYSEWLLDHGANVTAIDVSPKMITQAQKRLGDRATIRLADLESPLDFIEDNAFDFILSALTVDYVKDWTRLFNEFNRILKLNGRIVFSCGHPFWEHQLISDSDYYTVSRAEQVWTSFGIDVAVAWYRRSLGAVVSALTDNGFVIERLLEPGPNEKTKQASERIYNNLTQLPFFLMIRARKDRERMFSS